MLCFMAWIWVQALGAAEDGTTEKLFVATIELF